MIVIAVCLIIAIFIPLFLAIATVPYRLKQFGSVNFSNPRNQASQMEGVGRRLVAAQANAWEALAILLAALFVATEMNAETATIALAAEVFIGARIFHAMFYIADIAPLRTLSQWALAFGFSILRLPCDGTKCPFLL